MKIVSEENKGKLEQALTRLLLSHAASVTVRFCGKNIAHARHIEDKP